MRDREEGRRRWSRNRSWSFGGEGKREEEVGGTGEND